MSELQGFACEAYLWGACNSKRHRTSASWSRAAASSGSPPATVSVATEREAVEFTASGLSCASAVTPRRSMANPARPATADNRHHELVPLGLRATATAPQRHPGGYRIWARLQQAWSASKEPEPEPSARRKSKARTCVVHYVAQATEKVEGKPEAPEIYFSRNSNTEILHMGVQRSAVRPSPNVLYGLGLSAQQKRNK